MTKVVQITGSELHSLVALCDDGSLWWYWAGMEWRRLPPVPVGEPLPPIPQPQPLQEKK